MAEEYQKRFDEIASKLFHTPSKSKPSTNTNTNTNRMLGVRKPIGKRRQNPYSLSGSVIEELRSSLSAEAALCKPWDRDDLFRRLSTFKAMTWFAKPQVVSPLNCARRGWVNVDVDTIGCASCGARLLFSAPSVWTHQQVDKAAKVFSLKLESGHKLICPWINNVCFEELAKFPIVSRTALVEDYKRRFSALSQLVALPAIAPVVVDKMRDSELQQFLRDSSTPGHNLLIESSTSDLPIDTPEAVSTISYYQAQKLISLCGWEPRVLPYMVDFNDGQNQSTKNADVVQKQKTNVHSLCAETSKASCELQFDPSSIVLDCKLCGSSVGLWAFSTISRPTEYLRFVGLTEVNGDNDATRSEAGAQEGSSANGICTGTSLDARNVTLPSKSPGLTIAGGPTPEMLNYSATISFPVIGQSLRSRLLADTKSGDQTDVLRLSQMTPENTTLAITGLDSNIENLLQAPEVAAEDPISTENLDETVETVNPPISGHLALVVREFSSLTPDHSTSRVEGVGEPNRLEIIPVESSEESSRHTIGQGKDKELQSSSKSMEFDPIMHHRHFCPWIVSSGKFAPGWKETLTALQGQKKSSVSPMESTPSSSLIEVDDPIASVRRLFASPAEKRRKNTE